MLMRVMKVVFMFGMMMKIVVSIVMIMFCSMRILDWMLVLLCFCSVGGSRFVFVVVSMFFDGLVI